MSQRKGSKKFQIKATVELDRSAATMAGDAIVMSRHIKEDGVRGDPFLEAMDIGSGKVGLEMLMKWVMDCRR